MDRTEGRAWRVVAALSALLLLLVIGARARAEDVGLVADKPNVQVIAWEQLLLGAASDPDVLAGGRILAEFPLPIANAALRDYLPGPWITATLDVTGQPDAAFSFTNLGTFGRSVRFELNGRYPIAALNLESTPARYVLSMRVHWAFSTRAERETVPRRRYARDYALAFQVDGPGAVRVWSGVGRSEIVSEHRLQWMGGAQFPIPKADAVVLGLDYAVTIGPDRGPGGERSSDHAGIFLGVDVARLVSAIVK